MLAIVVAAKRVHQKGFVAVAAFELLSKLGQSRCPPGFAVEVTIAIWAVAEDDTWQELCLFILDLHLWSTGLSFLVEFECQWILLVGGIMVFFHLFLFVYYYSFECQGCLK